MFANSAKQKTTIRVLTVVLAAVMTLSVAAAVIGWLIPGSTQNGGGIHLFDGDLITNKENYYDSSVIYKLPETIKETDEISVIIEVKEKSLLEQYPGASSGMSFTEYALSDEAAAIRDRIAAEKRVLLSDLDKAELNYVTGEDYTNVLSGFELVIRAGDFEAIAKTVGDRGTTIIGEVYKPEETKSVGTQLVENTVNVYPTGIFNSSDFAYDGTGTVVAVLDTGLDYYHSAFSLANFTADRSQLGLTFDEVAALIGDTRASGMQSNLTASDVYINEKVPFSFDYADGDSDVYPIASDHGTHVAGIIAGKDDTITGVAPNAQLCIMKTFSDVETSARSAWILAALDDCVVIGVDVINMSLGTDCGFSREMDKEAISGVYDRIRAAGISIVAAASNSYNSTYSSEKNGNLGLTSNPDSATVGSPSTYKGALSVASISGTKTPYLLFGETIIYFLESSDRVSEEKNFYDDLLPDGVDEMEIEFITIPGAGRSADYTGIDVTGKIALVARGSTTFEEKANVAQQKGAAGIIIYNNVSGDIKMNVGDTTIAVASIRQDDGELLAAAGKGVLSVKRSQTSGPFMSDFSSWGPTPDLQLKPEITAHGGSILSAVPGQSYDRISGTSMATPNMSGVTALLRQYVKQNFPDKANDPVAVAAFVNQLLMSTADIVYNTNGLPYSPRKQGAGLANLTNSAATKAFVQTYDRKTGEIMDKSKIELGDDPTCTGVYTLKFAINNFGASALTYDVSALVMTEGVSDTKTNQGETTVTEQGYILGGASVVLTACSGGTASGNTVTVAGGKVAELTVTITLSEDDKKYLNDSFENGMYVEGFVTLTAKEGTAVSLNAPFLAFYGDWTEAPILDLDFFATNKDELDDSIDLLDKTLPDAYATRPVGRVEGDYVSFMGAYYFVQNPADKKIAADRKYISISNQEGAVNSVQYVWAGLLRNAKEVVVTVTDDVTGEVVYETVDRDIRKSYSNGATIFPANVDVKFSAIEQNLKNNTSYTVTLKTYMDYDRDGAETNDNNTFTFPVVTDFEAPAITDCEFYTEYDKSAKKTRLFAKMSVYDNHYAMCMQVGYVALEQDGYMVKAFDKYMTPVYSEENSTTTVIYELTDYVDEIRTGSANGNCITVVAYDYALNTAAYEIPLPDDYTDFYFTESELTLSPNEVYDLKPLVYPNTEWPELLEYYSANMDVATVVNDKLVAIAPGVSRIVARDPVTKKTASFTLTVRGEGDEGYVRYDKPVAENFRLTGYLVDKAYYFLSSEEREIGVDGDEMKFVGESYSLSMFPSEAVTLRYRLDAYFPEDTEVVFESSNENIVTVDETGKITAVSEGFASIAVKVMMDGNPTFFSKSISISVKDPYITTGPSLTHYFGLGGVVNIPASLSITEIGQYAFSNFDYIPKGPEDEISEDAPETTKIWFIGDDTVEEVIIPEGVKTIGPFAFANLTALKRVVLPSTLERIDQGAFYGCTALKSVEGLESVKFINQNAFADCALEGSIKLDSVVALADYAFFGNAPLKGVTLSASTQSVGAYAFAGCESLTAVNIPAEKIKLGRYAFSGCKSLPTVSINASVVPAGAFDGCAALTSVTLGKDVAVIGEYAFRGTALNAFTVDAGNTAFTVQSGKPYLLNKEGNTLILVAPGVKGSFELTDAKVTSIGTGAFSGNRQITSVKMPQVTVVGAYAFADCSKLESITLGKLTAIDNYSFYRTAIKTAPDLSGVSVIGEYAFARTALESVTIPDGVTVGNSAFRECKSLKSVTIGNSVVIGDSAFRLDIDSNYKADFYKVGDTRFYYYTLTSPLTSLTIGENVTVGHSAFYGASELENVTLGKGVSIGDFAFYNSMSLKGMDLSAVTAVGESAFSGDMLYVFSDSNMTVPALDEEGMYIYRYYAAALESVDLAAATAIGESAFAHCQSLVSVKLGDGITAIPAQAFFYCEALSDFDFKGVLSIGTNAFNSTALTAADLSTVEDIGTYAFVYNEGLSSVTLHPNGVSLGEGAFSYCEALSAVQNLNKVTSVGDYAFAYTSITSADLEAAAYIGTHAFLKTEMTDFTVTLGQALADLGDNPFANCRLEAFKSTETETFNGNEYATETLTFAISDTVRVIDGHLYRVVPTGLELIAYAGDTASVTVADGTVRIGDMAFAGAPVRQVVTPYTLKAIGHKAFYGCDKLTMLSFTSYFAPALEEAYDVELYNSKQHIPATGQYSFTGSAEGEEIYYDGLGIVPYFMWNASDTPSNVYYGANFVDYIGLTEGDLVMIRPVNGRQYDSFIWGQYFATVVDGAAAADDITLAAIAAIDALPETVSLADKPLVMAAREAYDKISTIEQRALVTNYAKLEQAEKRIKDLEYLENGDETETDTEDGGNGGFFESIPASALAMGALALLFLVAAIVFACLYLSKRKAVAAAAASGAAATPALDGEAEATAQASTEASAVADDADHSVSDADDADRAAADVPAEAPAEEEAPTEPTVKAPKKARKSRPKTNLKAFGKTRAPIHFSLPPAVTLAIVIVLAVAAVVFGVLAIVGGLSLWDTPYTGMDEEGYTVSVRFDANGGSFAGSPNEVYIVDVFNPADYKTDASGKAQIALIAPDDPIRKDSAFPVSNTGYFLAGWYTERTLRVDESGQPLDEYGKPTAQSGRPQGYTYSGKWDFKTDRLAVDPNGTKGSAESEITLYAAWVPYFNFEFYAEQADGSFSLIETKQLVTIDLPVWNERTGKLDMKDFPAVEGMTFESAFMDEAMTVPAEGKVSGNVDYTTGTVESDGTIRLYTTWMEGTWFRISTPKQFYDNARLGGSYLIEADLDFSNTLWPTVMSTGEFTGSIVGNGHTISNVTVLQGDNSKINGGLFGVLGASSSITDLRLENITFRIAAGSRMQGTNYGLLAGTVQEGATITGVTLTGTIEIGKDCYRPNDYNIGLLCGAGKIEGIDMSGIAVTVEDPDNNTARVEVDEITGEVTLTFAE
ncbi:MAG: leucine-rich repeat protein [Clostridia bacterium]|nr:leucine-rich repeat protein [Clostridia bacterium]